MTNATDSFNNIVAERDKLYRYAKAIVLDNDVAIDIVHDVIEKLWRKRITLNDCKSPISFAIICVRNAAYDYLRKQKIMEDNSYTDCPVNEENKHDWDTRRILVYAMSLLSDKQREIVHLKDVEGFDTAEIAEIMKIEPNGVRAVLSRSRKELRETITKIMNFGLIF